MHHLCLSIVAMVACFCVQIKQKEQGESFGVLGEFVREAEKKNQRLVLHWFLEQCHLEDVTSKDGNNFRGLCECFGV